MKNLQIPKVFSKQNFFFLLFSFFSVSFCFSFPFYLLWSICDSISFRCFGLPLLTNTPLEWIFFFFLFLFAFAVLIWFIFIFFSVRKIFKFIRLLRKEKQQENWRKCFPRTENEKMAIKNSRITEILNLGICISK